MAVFYYSLLELRRRPARFVGMFLIIGALLLSVTNLIMLLEGMASADFIYNPEEPKRDYVLSANYLIFVSGAVIILLSTLFVLLKNKIYHFSSEYAVFRSLGMKKRQVLFIQVIQTVIVFLASSAVFIPCSFAFMYFFVKFINFYTDRVDIIFAIPVLNILKLVCIMLFLAVVCVFVSYRTGTFKIKRGKYVKNVLEDNPSLKKYRKLNSKRTRKSNLQKNAVLFLIQILVAVFFIASLRAPYTPEFDCYIWTEGFDTIPDSVFEDLQAHPGITDIYFHESKYFSGYSSLYIIFDKSRAEETFEYIEAHEDIKNFKTHNSYREAIEVNKRNRIFMMFLFSSAVLMYFSALVTLIIILGDSIHFRKKEIGILRSLGLPTEKANKMILFDMMAIHLRSSVFAAIAGAGLYIVMEIEGGGIPDIPRVIVTAAGYILVQAAVLLCMGYFRFRKQKGETEIASAVSGRS